MPTSIIPRSELRKSENLVYGFAELPVVRMDDKVGWAIPGSGNNQIIFDKTKAILFAKELDALIRDRVNKTGRVLH